LKWISVSTIWV
jgi:hypothetical protein